MSILGEFTYCIGIYYDEKHNEYLLLTPNFRFTRMLGHCNNDEITEWAYKLKEKHLYS